MIESWPKGERIFLLVTVCSRGGVCFVLCVAICFIIQPNGVFECLKRVV